MRNAVSSDVGRSIPLLHDVIEALGAIGPAARDAVPDLKVLFEQKDDDIIRVEARLRAAAALVQISGESEQTLAVLTERLKHDNVQVRRDALIMLDAFEERAAPLADAMIACLKDQDRTVRTDAMRTLADLEALHDRLVAALRDALQDPDPLVVAAAILTLAREVDRPDDVRIPAEFQTEFQTP